MSHFIGHLVLVVGPSGAGKDSVLKGAMAEFGGDRRFVFPRRFVTRFADQNAEDHHTMTDMEFAIAVSNDAFALWWQAHGNFYGIGSSMDVDLEAGCVVAVNCSRAILAEAVDRYPHVTIVEITAPPEVLVQRIVARGREAEAEALERVSRKAPEFPAGVPVVRVSNDASLLEAVDGFCDLLERLEAQVKRPEPSSLSEGRADADDDHVPRRVSAAAACIYAGKFSSSNASKR